MNNTTASEVRLAQMAGDGEDVSAEELQAVIDEARETAKSASMTIRERRERSEATRFNVWEGQSPDGRKHSEAQDDKPAFPFEGASDARVRLADQVVNERVLILVAAALRNLPRVRGLDLEGEALGHKLTTLLRWVIRNQLGAEYLREVTKVAQYQEGDSPGAAMMGVWWEREEALEKRTVSLEDLRQLLLQEMGMDPATFAQLEAQLMNPDQDAKTAQALQQLASHLSTKTAKRIVKDLREKGQSSFPYLYVKKDGPAVCGYRLFQDAWLPANTLRDLQRARCLFLVEWVDEVELWSRTSASGANGSEANGGYSVSFVEEVLKHEGQSGFRWDQTAYSMAAVDTAAPQGRQFPEERRGLFEIVTVLYRAVDEDRVPGTYYFPFHFNVPEEAGHEKRLIDYAHGHFPVVGFYREILTDRLVDSRGVPELVATEQFSLKLLTDSYNDYVSLATVPPVRVPRRRAKLALVLGPLKLIKEDRPGEISYMPPPAEVQGNEKEREEVRRRVDEYFGRMSDKILPTLMQLHQTGMVQQFLGSMTEVVTQILQLCQQYLPDELVTKITGDDGIPIAHTREEIQGKFSVELSFDPRDLDMSYLKELMGLMVEVLQMDTLSTIQRDQLVQRLFMAINPTLASGTLRPVQAAQEDEVKDEKNNLAQIAAGIEPPMVAGGLNFGLRLQTVMESIRLNPEYMQNLKPMSQKIFEARLKYLQNQVQQQKNAQIGRQVGQPALTGGQAGPGGMPPAPGMSQGAGMPGGGMQQLGMGGGQ